MGDLGRLVDGHFATANLKGGDSDDSAINWGSAPTDGVHSTSPTISSSITQRPDATLNFTSPFVPLTAGSECAGALISSLSTDSSPSSEQSTTGPYQLDVDAIYHIARFDQRDVALAEPVQGFP